MIDTTGIIPAARPVVSVHAHPSGVYGAACKVTGCGFVATAGDRAEVEEQASRHRHQHVAAETRHLVQQLEAGGRS